MNEETRLGRLGFSFLCGPVAQLGERLVRNEEASGSIPLRSTIFSTACAYPSASLRGFVS